MKTLGNIELTDNERRSIQETALLMKTELPVSRVILFGSKARGTSRPDSDIDLLVLTSDPVTSELRQNISDRLFEISLNNDVAISAIVASEDDWSKELIHHLLIHKEVEREGCEV